MDEITKRIVERILKEESSLLNVQKRKILEEFEATQRRGALDAIREIPEYERTVIKTIAEENKRLAQSFAGLHFPTASDALINTVKNIALVEQRRLNDLAFPKASAVLAETIRHISRSEEFKVTQLTAAEAIASTLRVTEDYQRGIASTFAEMHKRVAAETVASLSELVRQQFKELEDVQSTFARSMVQEMRELLTDFERRQQLSIEELEQSLSKRIDELPNKIKDRSWIRNLQFLAAIASILGLLIALVQFADSKAESEQERERLKTVIVALIQQAISKTERELTIFYIAQRTVALKESPNHTSKTITTIPKGDEVRLIKRKHKWIYVEYTQDSDETPLYGWLDKKYLRLASASR
ncbi:MAG TPA: SH3 domain-containing protein [Pyrinomonadaceae bacterium]|nr:SH3 domain-containing protein [Pyrinomonadaceae bacterium]